MMGRLNDFFFFFFFLKLKCQSCEVEEHVAVHEV